MGVGVVAKKRRCNQCWELRFDWEFLSDRPKAQCATCRMRSKDESRGRRGLRAEGPTRVKFTLRSHNQKTGPIPVSITSSETCPPSCGLFGKGCYGETSYLKSHWKKTADTGMSWPAFLEKVEALPEGQIWRHNEVGDLPGQGEALDGYMLGDLVRANRGRRGFTFTHKTASPEAVLVANQNGFTINLSADSLEEADRLKETGAGPVVVLLPSDAPNRLRTPAGRKVIVCPAQRMDITCERCQLCARPQRKSIIGFRAHGHAAKTVSQGLVQLRLA